MGHNTKGKDILVFIIIIALLVVLGGLWIFNSRAQATRTKELKEEAMSMKSAAAVTTAEVIASSDEAGESEAEASSESAISSSDVETESTEEKFVPTGISVRGDSFDYDGADGTDGYPAMLEELLKQNGVELEVHDNTWDMSGTLTQLALADVSDADVQGYIDAHTKAANDAGYQPDAVESVVREDLNLRKTARTDQNDIPIIFMGYYGGYNRDVNELVEQQQKMLDTYSQQDEFIICGFYPSGSTDTAEYDEVMRKAWGEHYLQLNAVLVNANGMSYEGRQQFAQAIYEKLDVLGYI